MERPILTHGGNARKEVWYDIRGRGRGVGVGEGRAVRGDVKSL